MTTEIIWVPNGTHCHMGPGFCRNHREEFPLISQCVPGSGTQSIRLQVLLFSVVAINHNAESFLVLYTATWILMEPLSFMRLWMASTTTLLQRPSSPTTILHLLAATSASFRLINRLIEKAVLDPDDIQQIQNNLEGLSRPDNTFKNRRATDAHGNVIGYTWQTGGGGSCDVISSFTVRRCFWIDLAGHSTIMAGH
jgi:hypothetical protein